MLRALVVLLLLANLLVLAWMQGAFDALRGVRADAGREPDRLQRQVNPEQVRVMAASAASAALAAAARAAAASEAAARAGVCLEAGPIAPAAQAAAEKLLQDEGLAEGSWNAIVTERKGVFLIYMGRYADDETLQRKIEELKRLRIAPQPVRDAPELQPGLVLGRYDDKAEADAELGRLAQRGLRTARVHTLVPPGPQVMLRVPGANEALRDKLATLKLPGGPGFTRCVMPVAAAASAPAASAAAGPAASAAAVAARVAAPVAASAVVTPGSGPAARPVPAAAAPSASAPRTATPGGSAAAAPPAAQR